MRILNFEFSFRAPVIDVSFDEKKSEEETKLAQKFPFSVFFF